MVTSTGARFEFNLISTISLSGTVRFMVVEGTVGAAVFISFLKRLMSGSREPVFLIVDGHPSHTARCVREFVEANAEKIRLYFFRGSFQKPSTACDALS